MRVIEHSEVSKHLECTVRGKTGEHRLVKRCILDLQQKSAIRDGLGQHSFEARHSLAKDRENFIQSFRVLFLQLLNDVRQVVSSLRQPLLWTGFWLATCVVDGQVRNVPIRNELTERRHAWVLSELIKGIDGDEIRRAQRGFDAPV